MENHTVPFGVWWTLVCANMKKLLKGMISISVLLFIVCFVPSQSTHFFISPISSSILKLSGPTCYLHHYLFIIYECVFVCVCDVRGLVCMSVWDCMWVCVSECVCVCVFVYWCTWTNHPRHFYLCCLPVTENFQKSKFWKLTPSPSLTIRSGE